LNGSVVEIKAYAHSIAAFLEIAESTVLGLGGRPEQYAISQTPRASIIKSCDRSTHDSV
jgi:hypothetical protein